MGNSPSHAPAPVDGYLAVRASIEARFAQSAPSPAAAGPGGCDPMGNKRQGSSTRERHLKAARESRESSNGVCLEARTGAPLPQTLSVAETTDTNSDGAPDEFEAAAAAQELLGGRSQSFTRVKAPHVRAQSPLPFPSMANGSPTVSRTRRQPEMRQSISSHEEGHTEDFSQPSAPASQPSKPKGLSADFISRGRQPERAAAKPTAKHSPVAATKDSGRIEESEMFCPLSPNLALSSAIPKSDVTRSSRGAAKDRSKRTAAEGAGENVGYGPSCNHSPFLEDRALKALLPFLLGPSLAACMGVCVHWFMKISDGLADMCAPLSKDFEASYGRFLSPVSSTLKVQPLQTADGCGARLDWVISAKVLASASGFVLTLGYCFGYRWQPGGSSAVTDYRELSESFSSRWEADGGMSSRRSTLRNKQGTASARTPAILGPPERAGSFAGQNRRELSTFSVAVAPAGTRRRLWLHRDLCRFHGDETGQAVLTPLGPVCVGDVVEVPVVLSNGIGLADLQTVRWLPLQQAPRAPRALSGPRACTAVALGVYEGCGLEMQYVEWFDGDQYRHMTTERLKRAECMEPELQHLSTAYSGIDVLVRRSLYSAARAGSVGGAAQRAWGLQCQVVPADSLIVFPLTRRGLLHDRSTRLQLREGDILEAYLTLGGANF